MTKLNCGFTRHFFTSLCIIGSKCSHDNEFDLASLSAYNELTRKKITTLM